MRNKRIISVALALMTALTLCACDSKTISDNSSSAPATSSTEATSGNTEQSADTSSEAPKKELVENGIFALPNGNLSFKVPEGWKLTNATFLYQFGTDGSTNNFNLVVSVPDSDISTVTAEQMTKSYETTMENFHLDLFEHTEIAGKPAVSMKLTGKISQTDNMTVLTQYMIQSGADAYCLTFTDITGSPDFEQVITDVMNTLTIK